VRRVPPQARGDHPAQGLPARARHHTRRLRLCRPAPCRASRPRPPRPQIAQELQQELRAKEAGASGANPFQKAKAAAAAAGVQEDPFRDLVRQIRERGAARAPAAAAGGGGGGGGGGGHVSSDGVRHGSAGHRGAGGGGAQRRGLEGAAGGELPPGWVAVWSERARRPFYFHAASRVGTFEPFEPPAPPAPGGAPPGRAQGAACAGEGGAACPGGADNVFIQSTIREGRGRTIGGVADAGGVKRDREEEGAEGAKGSWPGGKEARHHLAEDGTHCRTVRDAACPISTG